MAALLQGAGHDAVTVPEQSLTGASDETIAAACVREEYVLVTLDTDFADIRSYPPQEHPELIAMRLSRQDRDRTLEVMTDVIQILPADPLVGMLWIVEEGRVRRRG